MGFTLSRILFAAVFFWGTCLVIPRERVSNRDLITIAAGGLSGFVGAQFFMMISLQYTTPVHYAMITALNPAIVMLLASIVLGESITRIKVAGVALGISGASLLIMRSYIGVYDPSNLLGIFFAFLAGLSYSLYIIITHNVSQKYSPVTVMRWLFLFTAIILLPFGGSELFEQPIFISKPTIQAIGLLAYIFIFSTAIGYLLMPVALKHLRATTVSIYMNLQPVVTAIVAIAVRQDTFTWEKPVAAILVIAGAFIVTSSYARKQHSD